MKSKEQLANYQAKQQIVERRAERNKKDNRLALIGGAVALLIAFGGQLAYFGFGPGSANEEIVAETSAANGRFLVPSKDKPQGRR